MTIEEMKRRKQELGYTNEQISEKSGVALGTVIKVFGGATKSPRSRTIKALERVLAPQRVSYASFSGDRKDSPQVCDEEIVYGTSPEKRHTVEEYFQLPPDVRTELIDGRFYDMASPSVNHQLILAELAGQFLDCQRAHPENCRVIFAPCDVQLDRDRYTMVQPDLMVVCDPGKLQKRVCYGAPDLTLEVLSPSSRGHDSVRKLHKYRAAGVREYWLVDPENETVIIYDFEKGDRFRLYTFEDKVPVGISEGRCEIDLTEVKEAML